MDISVDPNDGEGRNTVEVEDRRGKSCIGVARDAVIHRCGIRVTAYIQASHSSPETENVDFRLCG